MRRVDHRKSNSWKYIIMRNGQSLHFADPTQQAHEQDIPKKGIDIRHNKC
jgi:hypothetical protein